MGKYKCVTWSLSIITEWQHNSPEVNVMGFMKCCISNAVDGTDGSMLSGSEDGDSDTDW